MMIRAWDKITSGLCAIGGALIGLYGGWSVLIKVLLIFNVLDYLSGYVCAWAGRSPKTETGGVSSKVGFIGLAKKAFIWAVILIATQLDVVMGAEMFQTAAIGFYIANEGVSILENAAALGVPLPAIIRKALDMLKEQSEDKINDDEE